MRVFFLLTECVEILDGHTTNKRDPSDVIELRSAGTGDRRAGKMTRERHWNGATTLRRTAENESTEPSAMAVYVAGSKSCICHGDDGWGLRVIAAFPNPAESVRDARLLADVANVTIASEGRDWWKITSLASAIGVKLRKRARLQRIHLRTAA